MASGYKKKRKIKKDSFNGIKMLFDNCRLVALISRRVS